VSRDESSKSAESTVSRNTGAVDVCGAADASGSFDRLLDRLFEDSAAVARQYTRRIESMARSAELRARAESRTKFDREIRKRKKQSLSSEVHRFVTWLRFVPRQLDVALFRR